MSNNDTRLIWERYNIKLHEGTDGTTSDLTEREKAILAAKAAKVGKGPLAVKTEGPDSDVFGRSDHLEKILNMPHEDLKRLSDDDNHHARLMIKDELDNLSRRYDGRYPEDIERRANWMNRVMEDLYQASIDPN